MSSSFARNNIHLFPVALILHIIARNLESIPGVSGNEVRDILDKHMLTNYGQYRDQANWPEMPVFGLGEETRVPGGNP